MNKFLGELGFGLAVGLMIVDLIRPNPELYQFMTVLMFMSIRYQIESKYEE